MFRTWIVLGDIHNENANLKAIPELDEAEGIIISGDITFAQGPKQAAETLAPFIATGKKILAQPGNMDTPEVLDWLVGKGWNIHRKVQLLTANIPCLGLGFSPTTPFNTPGEYPEEQFELWLRETISQEPHLPDAENWIFVSHTPPYDTKCDKLTNGIPVGSKAIRRFIERYQPTYCLCGHIHEAVGTDSLRKTTVINPGAFSDGGYILLRIHEKTGHLTAELNNIFTR